MLERLYKRLLYGHVGIDYFAPEFRTQAMPGSDILLHLPVLTWYASRCESVVEFGVREGHSSLAFLSGLQKTGGILYSYDLDPCPLYNSLAQSCFWHFEQLDTLSTEAVQWVPQADLLFFDTLHTDAQLREELRLHGWKAKKWLVFHDTMTCGEKDLSGQDPAAQGISRAIEDYSNTHGLSLVYETEACNGLQIFQRNY